MKTICRVYYSSGESFNEFFEYSDAVSWRDINSPQAEILEITRDPNS